MIDWFSGLSWQKKWTVKVHHKDRPLMSVGTFTVSFIDMQLCHLWTHTNGTWNFFALKWSRRKMQMKCIAYSRNRMKKLRKSTKKYEKITDGFNWAEERVGPTSLGICRTQFWKKIKSWIMNSQKQLVLPSKKNLEKNLNFFQQVNCPNILAKVIKLFTEKNSTKSFITKNRYKDHVLHLLALN